MIPLKIALIGCGRIAKKHSEILTENAITGVKLSAVCDDKPDRAKKYGEKYKIPYFTDYNEMLRVCDSEIDCVNILTPSGLHAKHAIDVAKYKKHIVVEKPMALTLEDADAMTAAARAGGVRLFVVKQNRYNIPVQKMREALVDGRFGKLVMGTVRVRWCRTQEYYDQDSWRGKWALDGGVFSNQASHHIDLLEWMMGEVESVFAAAATRLVAIEAEDTGVVLLKFKNGALGLIEATTATRPKDLEGSISLLGEKGSVEIGGFAVNEMKVWNFKEPKPGDEEVLKKYRENPPTVYGFGHARYLQNVVDAIRGDKPALVEGPEGRKSLELIQAIYESIATGREVFLSEGKYPHSKLGRSQK